MKRARVLLCVVVVLVACRSEKQKDRDAYLALVEQTEKEYREDPSRAYKAEVRFASFVEDSMRRGIAFPDKKVLVWTYPRVALAAEYSGQKDVAARMFAFAEEYRKQVFPGEPLDRSGRFRTMREVVIYMDRNAGVPWLIEKIRQNSTSPEPKPPSGP